MGRLGESPRPDSKIHDQVKYDFVTDSRMLQYFNFISVYFVWENKSTTPRSGFLLTISFLLGMIEKEVS